MQPISPAGRRGGMSILRLAAAALSLAALAPGSSAVPVAAVVSPELPEGRHGGHVARPESADDHASHTHTHAPRVAPVRAAAAVRRVHWDGTPFATPEAAMRFLVAAYNARDDVAIRHVTTPDQRSHLIGMRDYAPTLRLKSCTRLDTGAYDCEFWHSVSEPAHGPEGYATFRVAPAGRPGWYMTILLDCGDA